MSYEFTIKIVHHPIGENWFCKIKPFNSNYSNIISVLWHLEKEVTPAWVYSSGEDHEFRVSGEVFANFMELHKSEFQPEPRIQELVSAIQQSKSPDRVKLSIVVEHP